MENKFKPGQIVAYCPRDTDGNIYKVEVGKIKSMAGEDGAFVLYSEGGTAARTLIKDLMPIDNAYLIRDTLGANA